MPQLGPTVASPPDSTSETPNGRARADRYRGTAQPLSFKALQTYLGKLDQILCAMAGVVDMTDELASAEKAAGKDDHQAQAYRQSRAYEALEPILTDAMRWTGHTRDELEHFLKASPSLAYWLERWKATPAEAA